MDIFRFLLENRAFLLIIITSQGFFKILGVNRNIISKDEIEGITLCIKRNYCEEFMKNTYNKNYVDSELVIERENLLLFP